MSRTLTPDSTLDTLKKEAKRWLKALRDGDAPARARLLAATPAAPAAPGLRDVQLALAREHGLPGWTALRQALDDLAMARRSLAERVEIVLRSAWGGDPGAAARILARWPEIGRHDLYTAVATGDLAEVRRRLAADPAAASAKGGPLGWEPLLYLAYARLPGDAAAEGVAIARLLIAHGADPAARFSDDWENPFTVLTGVIGEGEGDRAPHPQARELASLLIAHGADPFDTQAFYNNSITRDDTGWLDFLWAQSDARGELEKWRAGETIGGKIKLSVLDYLLGNATAHNHLRRAEWLLAHGAAPDSLHAYSLCPQREEALIHGHVAVAQLLERFGAERTALEGASAFRAACMRLDRDAARAAAARRPECLDEPEPMLSAARAGRADVVSLLLELGVDVDVGDEIEQRGVQVAVAGGSLAVVQLLVAHGADIDRATTSFGGGAMGYAAHFGRTEIAAFLAPLSRDLTHLVYMSFADRIRALLAAEPDLVNEVHPKWGSPPLFALPEDEDEAAEMAALLLALGADPLIRNTDGVTAEQHARTRGLVEAADLIRAAGP